jgi:hypothetical protein
VQRWLDKQPSVFGKGHNEAVRAIATVYKGAGGNMQKNKYYVLKKILRIFQ